MPYADDEDDNFRLSDGDVNEVDDADLAPHEEVETIACPHCGKQVYEEAERCHKCGHWIDHRQGARLPRWAIVTAVICLIIAILWVFGWPLCAPYIPVRP